jgi:hypothetical protein
MKQAAANRNSVIADRSHENRFVQFQISRDGLLNIEAMNHECPFSVEAGWQRSGQKTTHGAECASGTSVHQSQGVDYKTWP